MGLPLGLHNFYLGYTKRGITNVLLFLAVLVLLVVGLVGAVIAGLFWLGVVLFTVAGLLYLALLVRQLAEVALIATGVLQPRNGVYKPRFFWPLSACARFF